MPLLHLLFPNLDIHLARHLCCLKCELRNACDTLDFSNHSPITLSFLPSSPPPYEDTNSLLTMTSST